MPGAPLHAGVCLCKRGKEQRLGEDAQRAQTMKRERGITATLGGHSLPFGVQD